ncbi:MAG TPA: hypothetical protein VMU89_14955 [Thermomicrobiaceae bacterium]|nr:hypothetical protein [Thermomicrobiaceae bacterium]
MQAIADLAPVPTPTLLGMVRAYIEARQDLEDTMGSLEALQRVPLHGDEDWNTQLLEARQLVNETRLRAKHAERNLADHVVVLCRRLGLVDGPV